MRREGRRVVQALAFFNEAIVFQGASGEIFCCVKSNSHSEKKKTF